MDQEKDSFIYGPLFSLMPEIVTDEEVDPSEAPADGSVVTERIFQSIEDTLLSQKQVRNAVETACSAEKHRLQP